LKKCKAEDFDTECLTDYQGGMPNWKYHNDLTSKQTINVRSS